MSNSDFSCRQNTFFLEVAIAKRFSFKIPKKCTDLALSLLYISISGTYSKFTRENMFASTRRLLSSPVPALAAGLPRQDHVHSTTDESFRFHNKNFDEMRCKLDSTENF